MLILDKRIIASGYMVATYPNDDSSPYSGRDPYSYYGDGQWTDFEYGEIVDSEIFLVKLLDSAKHYSSAETKTKKIALEEPFPIYFETTISTVNTQSFNDHLLQWKRDIALSKLTDEDKAILGLIENKDVYI